MASEVGDKFSNQEVLSFLKTLSLSGTARKLIPCCSPRCSEGSIISSLLRLQKEYNRLVKSKHRDDGKKALEEFLESDYEPPQPKDHLTTRPASTSSLCSNSCEPSCSYKEAATKLAHELEMKEQKLAGATQMLDEQAAELKATHESHEAVKEKLDRAKITTKRTRVREEYYKKKRQKLLNQFHDDYLEIYNEETQSKLEEEVKELKEETRELREENKTLQEKVRRLEKEEIETFNQEKNCYSDNITKCIYELLNHHVGVNHVSPCISAVLEHLTGRHCTRLPCKSTVENMSLQRLYISQEHLAAELSTKPNTTLYSDETSKYGEKVMGFHCSDEDKRFYVLGLRDMTTKSAEDTMHTFKELIEDINDVSKEGGPGSQILINIANTMSDRAATELKWHELLEKYRQDVFPTIQENWGNMDENERRPLDELNSFFCGLHSLVQYAEVAESALQEAEKEICGEGKCGAAGKGKCFRNESKNSVLRLIKNGSKAFARGGNEQAGVYGQFRIDIQQFLEEHKLRRVPLEPFHGNRFNIIFFNAGHIYFLHEQMSAFLEKYGASNNLTQSVQLDLQEDYVLAGLRALGLISKLVTGPLWRKLEDRTIHILDMSSVYTDLYSILQDGSNDPAKFMKGELSMCSVDDVEDPVLEKLLHPTKFDGLVEVILRNVLPALAKVVKSHAAEFLPGGSLHEDIPHMRPALSSVEKHNKFAERVFAYLDQLMKWRPNAKLLAHEATIMYSLNKTSSWISGMSSDEAATLIADARRKTRDIKKKYKERTDHIIQQKRELLRKKEEEKRTREAKRLQDLQKYTEDIQYYGLWQSVRQVDEMVESFTSKSQKVTALKAQLKFRQQVLKQSPTDPKLFMYSKRVGGSTIQLSVGEMASNVKTLVEEAFTSATCTTETTDDMAPLLVGKRVHHRFEDAEYQGRVISQVPGYPAWYNIAYDGDEAIYTYKLLEDYSQGDLKIIC